MTPNRPDRLIEELRADPGLTHSELSERTGLSSRHVLFLLYRLEADGRVGHEANRWYPSTPG